MRKLLRFMFLVPILATLALPAFAQQRAYAPENLRTLSRTDQERVIRLEYSEQSNGRSIPDDQLRFYLDQVNRSSWGFSKVKADIATSLAGTSPQPVPGDTIRCESVNDRVQNCPTPWPGASRLVRQLSKAHCTLGGTWQTRQGLVSVTSGCRGVFAEAAPGPGTGIVRCESNDNRSQTCRTPWSGPSRLVRQLSQSPCEEGRTWQSQQGQVYVGGGCRAEFAAAAQPPVNRTVRCESVNGRDNTCPVPWSGKSRLVRQLSTTRCDEGRSWQSLQGQVYVGSNCRAEFAAAATTPPPSASTIRCESPGSSYRTCNTPWRGPSRLVRQLSSASCTEGRTWGSRTGEVWVSNGCRAEFMQGTGAPAGYSVTCESTGSLIPTVCTWDARQGSPYLQQQLSSSPCIEKLTWGYTSSMGLWVSAGCRARFATRAR